MCLFKGFRMALVRYGGGVLAMSGSVGGQVHSRNRFGNYIRARTTPVNPSSSRQQFMRAITGFLAPGWGGNLTQILRDAWEVYADAITFTNKLGEQVKLTGFNHYMRTNSFALQNSSPVLFAAPTILTLAPQDALFAAVVDEAGQEISVTFDDTMDWVDQDNGMMGVYMSTPVGAGRKFIGGPWRLAGTINGDSTTPPTTPTVLSVPFPVAQNQIVEVRARILEEDGRLSDLFRHTSSVTA